MDSLWLFELWQDSLWGPWCENTLNNLRPSDVICVILYTIMSNHSLQEPWLSRLKKKLPHHTGLEPAGLPSDCVSIMVAVGSQAADVTPTPRWTTNRGSPCSVFALPHAAWAESLLPSVYSCKKGQPGSRKTITHHPAHAVSALTPLSEPCTDLWSHWAEPELLISLQLTTIGF